MQVKQPTVHEEPDLWASVGNTPLLALQLPPGEGELYVKAEWLNPGGSVKDRAARAILRDGLCRGELPATRLLDASRGNASPERRALLEIYGAEVVLTDRLEGTDGAMQRAQELATEQPERYYYADQYSNAANPQAHR